MGMLRATGLFSIFSCLLPALAVAASGLVWPTPNPAFQEGRSIEDFVQPTVSGDPESGLFGCVRNNGAKFHEGLDLFPVERDRRGEARDPVYAILPGRVTYVSRTAGHSSYGRYLVVKHEGESPAWHSLYAHMASIDQAIQVGARVEAGTVLGVMGRSAAGYSIPRSRAHLHLEIGFRLSDDFQSWYDREPFGSKNRHGLWNGMNLVGLDPLDFYLAMRAGEVSDLRGYLQRLPVAGRVRVATRRVPDFVKRYPALLTRTHEGRELVAWDIAFTKFGLPKEWTPRFEEEGLLGRPGEVKVLTYNPDLLKAQTCRRVIEISGRQPTISAGTLSTLKKLFGFH